MWIEYARTSFITFYDFFFSVSFWFLRDCVSVSIATVINTEENIAHVQYILVVAAVWRCGISRSCMRHANSATQHSPQYQTTEHKKKWQLFNLFVALMLRWPHDTLMPVHFAYKYICVASRIIVLAERCACVRLLSAHKTYQMTQWKTLRDEVCALPDIFRFQFSSANEKSWPFDSALGVFCVTLFCRTRFACAPLKLWLSFISFIAP